jgi:hypothetical protein
MKEKRAKAQKAAGDLDLVEDGDGFILSVTNAAGKTIPVRLTEDQVITLSQSAPTYLGRILLRRNPSAAGIGAVAVTHVARAEVNQDAIGENILLALVGPNGGRLTYRLSVQTAELLVDALRPELADLKAKKNDQTRN